VIVGGTLLLTPGFVTDLVGFLLLLGPSRRLVAGVLRRRVASGLGLGTPRRDGAGSSRRAARGRSPGAEGPDLDVEVVEIEREQRPPDTSADPEVDGPR
jgi:UPF0716 protein FxsA